MKGKHKHNLPHNFKVGQQVEAKSFEEGYRGAWFRCKIKDCSTKCGEPTVALDYLDYEDYKNYWVDLYEYHPSLAEKHRDSENRQLMLRPSYPRIYFQSQMPDICEISETVGIVDGTWEVGDMVDWLRQGCYWSAQIIQVLDEKNVEIQLPEPPMGEGETYKALCKDLRPSLDWTPKLGWTLPIFEVGKDFRRCVRLIQPKGPGQVIKNAVGSSKTSSYVSSNTSAGPVHLELPIASFRSEPPGQSSHSLERENLEKHSGNLLNKQKTDTSSINSAGSMHQELPIASLRRQKLKKASPFQIKNSLAEPPELSSHSREKENLEKHSGNLLNKQKTDTSSINSAGSTHQELPIASLRRPKLRKASVSKIKNSLAEPSQLSSHSLERENLEKHSGNLLNKQTTATSSINSAGSMRQELPIASLRRPKRKKASATRIKNRLAEPSELSLHSLERENLEKHSGNLLNKQKTGTSSIKYDGAEETSWSDGVSSRHDDNCETVLAASREDRTDSCGSSEKMKKCDTELKSAASNTIESSIMGLEELVNKVRLLRGVLNYGFECDEAFMKVFGDRSRLEGGWESASDSDL